MRLHIHVALLQRLHIVQPRGRTKRRREPVRSPIHRRADLHPGTRRLPGIQHRTPIRPNLLRPIQFLHERRRRQQLPVGPVQHIEKAVAIGLNQQLARRALPVDIHQHRRLRGIPIENIVRGELVMPLQLPGRRIQCQNRAGIQVIPAAVFIVQIRPGIPGGPVQRVRLRIESPREPRHRAGMIDALALPRLRPRLAALRHGPESPQLFARGLIVGRHETARALLAPRRSRNHHPSHRQRSRRRVIVLPPIRHLGFPLHGAREPV